MTHWAIKMVKGFAIFVVFILLSLSIFGAATIIIMDMTVLNAKFCQTQLDKNNGYGLMSDFLVDQLSQMAANQSSNNTSSTNSQTPAVDEQLKQQLSQSLSPEKLKAQIDPQINNIFDYLNSKTDTLTISFDLTEFKAAMQGTDASEALNNIPDTYTVTQTGTGAGVYAQLTSARGVVTVMHTLFYLLLILIPFFLFLLYLLYRPNWKRFISQTGTNILIDGVLSVIAFMLIKMALLTQIAVGVPPQAAGPALGLVTGFISTAITVFIVITAVGLGILIGSFFVKAQGEYVKEVKKTPKAEETKINSGKEIKHTKHETQEKPKQEIAEHKHKKNRLKHKKKKH